MVIIKTALAACSPLHTGKCRCKKGSHIPDFRKYMILKLPDNTVHPIPAKPVTVEMYYAVDNVNQ